MKISATQHSVNTCQSDIIVIGQFSDGKNSLANQFEEKIQNEYKQRLSHQDFVAKSGQTLSLYTESGQQLLFLGLGENKKCTETSLYNTVHKAIAGIAKTRSLTASIYLLNLNFDKLNANKACKLVCLAASHAEYRYEDTKSFKKDDKHNINKLEIYVNKDQLESLTQAIAMATGINTTRHLGNCPANICHPKYIAKYAQKIASQHKNCSIDVLKHKQMKKMGMGALLAVAQGSANKPRMIVLKYKGADENQPALVLVGKGITFDTGGISLKPGPDMDEMKYDMCGAASVIGTFVAVAKLQLPINLTVIVPAVENMPDGKAYRPGDVITSYSGKTIEVLNTDAEGRMILCDALTYAQEFKPSLILDVATLTGACVIALGHETSAVMTKTEGLAQEIMAAGIKVHDRVWELPLWDEYQKQ
ncbi:MAG: leucyl aminopeptidase, partial [Proteobacteria bacterium]|nr:leucyl aminopeptidase [Pseudomonadota bacterium]